MVTLNAHFDGKTLVPDEPLSLAPNQKVRITIEAIELMPTALDTTPKRQLGLQRGTVLEMTPDFNDDLGDHFWLGDN